VKVVIQNAKPFDPGPAEIEAAIEARKKREEPLTLRVETGNFSIDALEEVKSVIEHHRGESDVLIVIQGDGPERRLKLGPDYRVRRSAGLVSEIDEIFGTGAIGEAA
jgi:hypothetical protein